MVRLTTNLDVEQPVPQHRHHDRGGNDGESQDEQHAADGVGHELVRHDQQEEGGDEAEQQPLQLRPCPSRGLALATDEGDQRDRTGDEQEHRDRTELHDRPRQH